MYFKRFSYYFFYLFYCFLSMTFLCLIFIWLYPARY